MITFCKITKGIPGLQGFSNGTKSQGKPFGFVGILESVEASRREFLHFERGVRLIIESYHDITILCQHQQIGNQLGSCLEHDYQVM